MQKRTYFIVGLMLAAILATGILLSGCGAEPRGGGLQVTFDNMIRERTILPDQPMVPDEYEVQLLNGPEAFDPQTVPASQGSILFENVFPGTYDITVIAFASSVAIGEGTDQVTVAVGETAQCTVEINEYSGLGDLSGTVSWQPDVVAVPIISSYIKDSAGTQTDLTYSVDAVACNATTAQADLQNGFYSMVCKVYDSYEQPDSLATGFAEVVRIVKDQETTFDIFLNAAEGEGEVEILFNTDGMNDPLEATFDVAPGEMDLIPGQTVDINIQSVDTASYTSVWYITGVQEAVDQDTFSIVADDYQREVRKRLDLLLFSADGTRAASYTWAFKVLDVEPLDPNTLETNFWLDDLTGIEQVRIMYLEDTGTANGTPRNSNGQVIPVADLTAGEPYTNSYAGLPDGDYLIHATIYKTDTTQYEIWSHGGTSFFDATEEDFIVIPHVGAHMPYHDIGDLD